jgi:hypothetical protein
MLHLKLSSLRRYLRSKEKLWRCLKLLRKKPIRIELKGIMVNIDGKKRFFDYFKFDQLFNKIVRMTIKVFNKLNR